MKWCCAVSREEAGRDAVTDAAERLLAQLGAQPDLILAFISPEHASQAVSVAGEISQRFPEATVLGCSAGGLVSENEELEQVPGMVLTGALLPGVDLHPVRFDAGDAGDAGDGGQDAPDWSKLGAGTAGPTVGLMLLSDPFSCDPERLVAALDVQFPDVIKFGGVASGSEEPGESVLILDEQVFRDGAIGLCFSGNVEIDSVISQGCRPVGDALIVTSCNNNVIYRFDRGRPDESLRTLYGQLDDRERELFSDSLFFGVQMRDKVGEAYGQGDFLIRSIIGLDPDSGAMAIGAPASPYMVAQFHLRDAEAAEADLRARLEAYRDEHVSLPPPAGTLLFTCLGRGKALYGEPGRDSYFLADVLGEKPAGGFFCNGEVGSVGGHSYVHGYTSAFVFFRPAR